VRNPDRPATRCARLYTNKRKRRKKIVIRAGKNTIWLTAGRALLTNSTVFRGGLSSFLCPDSASRSTSAVFHTSFSRRISMNSAGNVWRSTWKTTRTFRENVFYIDGKSVKNLLDDVSHRLTRSLVLSLSLSLSLSSEYSDLWPKPIDRILSISAGHNSRGTAEDASIETQPP